MNAMAEILKQCREMDPDTFPGNLLAQASKELEEYNHLCSIIVCAYCGHESPRDDKMAIVDHTINCEKRPEKKLLEKAFEIEDRLYQRITHLTQHGYNPEACDDCREIADVLRIYQEYERAPAPDDIPDGEESGLTITQADRRDESVSDDMPFGGWKPNDADLDTIPPAA